MVQTSSVLVLLCLVYVHTTLHDVYMVHGIETLKRTQGQWMENVQKNNSL